MDNNYFNMKKQELENTVNADYEKLNETGKNMYLETRKNKIKKSYILLISIFSVLSIILLICGICLTEGDIYIFTFSGVFFVMTILSGFGMFFELKQPNEKLIKIEIRQRLLPDFVNKITSQREQNINQISNDFYADNTIKLITGGWSSSAILIDNEKKKFIYKKGKILSRPYKFSDIINYEVYENGSSKVKGTAGKALIGGAFFGLAGLIVGSSMGKKVNEKCNQLKLIIRVNDVANPQIVITYIDNVDWDKSGFNYRNMKENLQEVCSMLEFMINSKTLEEPEKTNNHNNEKSDKDQLLELKEMLDEGLITQEEYDQKKKQILGL